MHSHLESKSKHHVAEGAKAVPVNSEKYLQIDLNEIPADEKFFYRYALYQEPILNCIEHTFINVHVLS